MTLGCLAAGAVMLAGCGVARHPSPSSQEIAADSGAAPATKLAQMQAERSQALWLAYLTTERPRLADTTIVRRLQTHFATDQYTAEALEGRFSLSGPVPPAPSTFHGYRILAARRAITILRTRPRFSLPGLGLLPARSVRLTWASFDTASGRRRLPAWEFHAGPQSSPLFALAVGKPAFRLPTTVWLSRTVGGPEVETSAKLSSDRRTLTISFVGALKGNKPCDVRWYSARALQSRAVVTYWVIPHTSPGTPTDIACPAVGQTRTATLTLAKPLNHRPLIDSRDAAPVRVTSYFPRINDGN
jgi:hypothetical protein